MLSAPLIITVIVIMSVGIQILLDVTVPTTSRMSTFISFLNWGISPIFMFFFVKFQYGTLVGFLVAFGLILILLTVKQTTRSTMKERTEPSKDYDLSDREQNM